MNSILSPKDSLSFTIEYYRTILNDLLLCFEPTNEIVVKVSQQLDMHINEYNKRFIVNKCKYIA